MNLRIAVGGLVLSLLIAPALCASLEITSIGPRTITFEGSGSGDAFSGSGAFSGAVFSPTPSAGQLDSTTWAVVLTPGNATATMAFGGTQTGPNFTSPLTTGGSGQDGVNVFNVASPATNRVLGVQPT